MILIIADPKTIAHAFNDYITNIGNSLAIILTQNVQNSPLEYLKHDQYPICFISPTTPNEIENEVSKRNLGKSNKFFACLQGEKI